MFGTDPYQEYLRRKQTQQGRGMTSRAPTVPTVSGKKDSIGGVTVAPPRADTSASRPVDASGLYQALFGSGGEDAVAGDSGADTISGGDSSKSEPNWFEKNDIGSLLFNVGVNALGANNWGQAIAGGVSGWSQGRQNAAQQALAKERMAMERERLGMDREAHQASLASAQAKAQQEQAARQQLMDFAGSDAFFQAYPRANQADRQNYMLLGPDKFDAAYRARWKPEVSGDNIVVPGDFDRGGMARPGAGEPVSAEGAAQPNAAVLGYMPQIEAAAKEHGLDPQLYARLIMQESGGNPQAISPKGARGLSQLMPGTARDLGVSDPHDPNQAIPAGARYLAQMRDQFGGDINKALAAYNWGPANTKLWSSSGGDWSKLPAETRKYLTRVGGQSQSTPQGSGIPGVYRLSRDPEWQETTIDGVPVLRNGRTGDIKAMPQGQEAWREETRDGRKVMVSNRGEVKDVPGQAPVGQRFDQAAKLRDDFNALQPVKDFREVSTILGSMEEAANREGGAADLNLVYGLAKIMDPGSVVREGEQVLVRNSQGLSDQIMGWITRVNNGQGLTSDARKALMIEARSRAKGRMEGYKAVEDQFRGIAERAGISPDDVLIRPPTLSSDDVARAAGTKPEATRVEGAYMPPDPTKWQKVPGLAEMQEQDRQKALQTEQADLAAAREAMAKRNEMRRLSGQLQANDAIQRQRYDAMTHFGGR